LHPAALASGTVSEQRARRRATGGGRRWTRRVFLGVALVAGGGAVGVPAAWVYGSRIEARWLEVTRLRVPVAGLPAALSGLTIGQISDLHFGPVVDAARVRAAVDVLLRARSDVAVVTGDFVSRLDGGEADLVVRELSRLRAPLGQFAILGNHDHWTNPVEVADAVRRAGLTLLRNAHQPIARDGGRLWLAGVDDVWMGKANLPQALDGVPSDGRVVLLAHEPDFADDAAQDRRVALQLSGHTHGGQIRLPLFGAPILPPFGRKYPYGLRRVGGVTLYTNRGIGLIQPAVRLNCRPEVTVVELVPA
jgi:predicted MPP superfamily phosphohydrolase